MNSTTNMYTRHLREFMTGSLTTMNLITMFWLASREGGVQMPEMKTKGLRGQEVHGRNRKPNAP